MRHFVSELVDDFEKEGISHLSRSLSSIRDKYDESYIVKPWANALILRVIEEKKEFYRTKYNYK